MKSILAYADGLILFLTRSKGRDFPAVNRERHGEGRKVRERGLVLEVDGVEEQRMCEKEKDSPHSPADILIFSPVRPILDF